MRLFTIGCSFTEGQELEKQDKESYTKKLSDKLSIQYFNFGACGFSNDYIFRKIFELIYSNTITKEDIIVIQWTHFSRKELPVVHNGKKWYHSLPKAYHAYSDKIIKTDKKYLAAEKYINFVQNEHPNPVLNPDSKQIELDNKEILQNYIIKFLHDDYQKNTTKNYINGLYYYLEYFGYKHIHFFGWNDCIVDDVMENKEKFIKETFREFTNTPNPGHPNKEGHSDWANHLYDKILELNYYKNKLI